MLCETCNRTEATIHVTTITHGGNDATEHHFCPQCATDEVDSQLYSVEVEPSDITKPRPLISYSPEVRAKVQSVDDRLSELDPIFRAFCMRREGTLHLVSGVDPARRIWVRGEMN